MFKHILTYFLIVFIQQSTNAQFNESIRTGRPGQGTGSFAVGKKVLQMQTGYDIGGNIANNNYQYANINTNIRFGILERFEINSAWAYQDEKTLANKLSGLTLSTIGTRLHLLNPTKNLPSIGLQFSAKLPFRTGDYTAKHIDFTSLLSITKNFGKKSSVLLNLVHNQSNNSNTNYWNYVINYGYNISDKWGVFIENYTNFTKNHFDNYWDTGFSYLVNNNLQLDVYGGTSLNKTYSDFFISIGFSGRIVSLRK
ncbi:transporter [Crocinitomicaceae bacterium]|nr:transporter [Crocinitomicaceae bacterium]